MCAILNRHPVSKTTHAPVMSIIQIWFTNVQQRLAERVGEPVMLTIKMPFDEWFDVKIQTFNEERFGIAAGRDLEITIEEAVEMLLELDQVIADIKR